MEINVNLSKSFKISFHQKELQDILPPTSETSSLRRGLIVTIKLGPS
jgi:hypothetical protein